jgi:hypothetical protein
LNLHFGHCQVACRHSISAPQRTQSSVCFGSFTPETLGVLSAVRVRAPIVA